MKCIWIFFSMATLLYCLKPNSILADIHGHADMNYQKSTSSASGISSETSSFNQGYSLGLGKTITSTLRLMADIRLTINERDGKQTEDIFPMIQLDFTPPAVQLYYLSLGYNRTESAPANTDPFSTTSMNASFSLPLEGWPSISISYNRSTVKDYIYPHKIDNISTNKSFNTNYGFNFFKTATNATYSYTDPILEDMVSNNQSETQNHLASISVSRSFWDEKIKANANAGYSTSKNISESLGTPTRFERVLGATEGLYIEDTTPDNTNLPASTPTLIDHNTSSTSGINLNGSYRNIAIKYTTPQSVHKIQLYISTSDTNIATYTTNSFGWQLYTSSDGLNWTALAGTITVSYDSVSSKIIFEFSETNAQYFKVVNTNFPPAALAINVTEIEALDYINSTPTIKYIYTTTRDFGGISFSVTPVEQLSINYNIDYNHTIQDYSNSDSSSINQGSSANWVAVPQYLILSAGYNTMSSSISSQNYSQGKTTSETGTDSYTLSLSSTPLSTLRTGLGYSYNESLTGGETYSNSDSLSGNLSINLYKGVDINFGSSMSESRDLKSNTKTASTSHSGSLNLIPWKQLSIGVNGGYSSSTSDAQGNKTSSDSQSLTTSFSYVPTRKIYGSVSIAIEPTQSQSYSITWLPTRSIQTSIGYGISGDNTNKRTNISWTPIPRLSLNIGYTGTNISNATNDYYETIFMSMSLGL